MGRKQSTAKTLRRGLIEEIYNSTPMPEPTPQENPYQPSFNSGMSRDEIANIYNSYNPTQEIPKLEEQNTSPTAPTPSISDELKRMEQAKADTTTPRTQGEQQAIDTYYNSLLEANRQSAPKQSTPTTDYKAEIERVNAMKADTSAVRTEGENKAIDDYLASLEEAQRYVDSQKPQTPGKKHIGTVEIKADGTKEYTKAMSDNEKRDFERRMRMDQAKVIGRQAKENAQPRERALSANEQRDYDRAMEAIAKQPTKEEKSVLMPTTSGENKTDELTVGTIRKEEDKSLAGKLKPFTEPFKNLPKKEQPRYDDRGFLINPSITENQDKVDSYLDPNKKLSEKDLSDAKKLIQEYENSELGEKNENAYTLVFDDEHPDGYSVPIYTVDENGNYDPSKELTPEERQYRQSMGELKTKVSDSESFLVGAMKTVPFVDALQKAGDVNGEYARMSANSLKQNPLAYMGGLFTGGAMSNAAGQFALKGTGYGDWLAKTLGADKSLGRQFLTDALMDAPVDVATDIIPTLAADAASGMSAGDVAKSTLGNIGINAAFNLGGSMLENLGDIIGAAKKAPVRAFEDPIKQLEGADYFAELANRKRTIEEMQRLSQLGEAEKTAEVTPFVNKVDEIVDEIPRVEEPVVENIPTNNKGIVSLSPDLDSELDAAVRDTVERNSAIDVKSVKVANKQLDNNINSLANMFGKNKNNEGVVALKEALNEYAETGSEEALNRARTIANNMDGYYSGATYKSRKGNITDFGNGTKGTFTSQVDDFADKLSTGATIQSTPLHVTDLDKRINDLFSKYNLTADDAESVRAWKQAINDYMAEPTEDAWRNLLDSAGNVSERTKNMSEFISSYKGKVKSNSFDRSELDEIMDEIITRRPLSNGAGVPNPNVPNVPKQTARTFNADEVAQIKDEVAALKRSFIGKSKWVGDINNEYALIFRKSLDDFAKKPSAETYVNARKALDDYMANSSTKRMRAWNGDWYEKTFDNIGTNRQSTFVQSMDDLARKYGIDQINPTDNISSAVPAKVSGNNVPPTSTTPIVPPEGNGELVERGMSRHVRNDGTPMRIDVPEEIKTSFEENPEMYKRLTNAETKARADAIYERGGDVETTFRRMLSQKDPVSLALGHRIAQDLSANGQYERAAQIYRDMGRELTQAGQFSQASVLAMMKNDPLTALYYAQKEIDNLNVNGAKRFGDKWKDFELTPEEVKAFGKIEPGDEKAIAKIYDQIGARLGKEYPTTFMDKLLEGRRIAMLFNLRTNIRNFGANAPTLGMRWVSDRIDSLGQHYVHLLNPDFEVTNSLKGAGIKGRKLANKVYNSDTVQALLRNTNGKYSPDITSSLMQNKQMFKGTPLEKWINKATNGGIEKINKKLFGKEGVESGLETIRNATYAALELGDSPYVKENFVERLGSYINAKGIKDIKDIPDDAIQVAWEEAMKATYKDNSWAVKMLRNARSSLENIPGIGRPLGQSVIPFLQAPGNIAARMVDYSPIKATKGIADMISGANANDLNKVRKGIEEFSKGATGSGMIVLGMKLKQSGLITGDYSEDKDQRNFEKQHGFKPYALHVGDKYFTYDWAQPFAEPMIIGTLLQEAIDNSDQYDNDILRYFGIEGTTAGKVTGGVWEGAKATANSWFNASPLQGIADLMKGDYSGEADIAQNVFDTTVSDFASSFIPSLVNATAKSADPTMRNTYDPSNTFGTFLNEQAAKIPGLSDNLPAKYDTWGNEMKYADSKGESFARKFVVPGDYGKDSDDPIDQEINSLFESTSDNRVFPMTAPNKVDGVTLNNKEVSAYQEDMGKRSREIVESFMDSDYYNDLEDNEKAETLNTIYSVSKAITERDLFDKQVADNSTYKGAIAAYDEGGAEGLTNYLEGRKVAKESGVKTTSKAGQAIQDLFDSGDREGAQRLSEQISRLSDEGLNTEQQGVYASRGSMYYDADTYANLYDEINTDDKPNITQSEALDYLNKKFKKGTVQEQHEALQIYESMVTKYTPGESKFAKYDPEQKKYVAVDPKDAKNGYSTSLIPKVEPVEKPKPKNQDKEWASATLSEDPYTAIAQSGVGHGNQYIDAAWDKAILANSNLTPQEFIDTWGAIDTNGSGKHDKDEFRAYLNDNNIGEQEGKMILDMYYPSNWGKITYKNGTWK